MKENECGGECFVLKRLCMFWESKEKKKNCEKHMKKKNRKEKKERKKELVLPFCSKVEFSFKSEF